MLVTLRKKRGYFAAMMCPVFTCSGALWAAQIEEVRVVARGSAIQPDELEPSHVLDPAIMERSTPRVASQAVALLPGVHMQTNSRGESIAYVRGSGERQMTVYLDGAPINVPWDHRLDLGAIPAALIGTVGMARGATSIKYGPNAIGGAITLVPRTANGERYSVNLQSGLHGMGAVDASLAGGGERVRYRVGGSYLDERGDPLSGRADLPFSQEGSSRRSNTDRQLASLYARTEIALAPDHDLVLGVYHSRADRGVAAEGHIDPEVGNARFWRYPRQDMTLAIANGSGALNEYWTYNVSAWWQDYRQHIDSFTDLSLSTRTGRQEDHDRTLGIRGSVAYEYEAHRVELFTTALQADHRQRDFAATDLRDALTPEPLNYRQRNLSAGAEYTYSFTDRLRARVGASRDGFATPRTGEFESLGRLSENAYSATLQADVGLAWTLSASAARKVRFPSMRELYGEDLQRFLSNPDLTPETAVLFDLSARWQGTRATLEINPFLNRTSDTIDQRIVQVDGVALRQRFNLEGSRVIGADVIGSWMLTDKLELIAQSTFMQVRPRGDAEGTLSRIPEKPSVIARWELVYQPVPSLEIAAVATHRGRAFSQDESNQLEPLPRATRYDFQVAYRPEFRLGSDADLELFLRIENLTDELIVPQLGLPDPGRTILLGLRFSA